MIRETELYDPIKTFLEGQGYEVKGEIGAVDLMAVRDGDDPVLVELKTGFSLSLFHQGIERQKVTDWVYIAVPRGSGKRWLSGLKANKALCRRLGLGLIIVRLRDNLVEVVQDPAPYKPRQSKPRKARLLREFAKRAGDPNKGGAVRKGLITAYRQDAIRVARFLQENGPSKGALVAKSTGVKTATRIMADDHYGWFERVETGIYQITDKGAEALKSYVDAV